VKDRGKQGRKVSSGRGGRELSGLMTLCCKTEMGCWKCQPARDAC